MQDDPDPFRHPSTSLGTELNRLVPELVEGVKGVEKKA